MPKTNTKGLFGVLYFMFGTVLKQFGCLNTKHKTPNTKHKLITSTLPAEILHKLHSFIGRRITAFGLAHFSSKIG